MKFKIIASGSKGNCTYVETSSHKYLIDLGRNKKYILDINYVNKFMGKG